jgi:outer membrane protein assembly factor BamB
MLSYVAAILGAVSFSCQAMLISVDGSADLRIVVVTPDTLVGQLTVSGGDRSELIGLDANTGVLRWRHAVEFRITAGACEGNVFYVVSANALQKRDGKSGAVLWQTNLLAISQQKTATRKTVGELVESAKAFSLARHPRR